MILDASVVLKWFVEETDSAKARKIQDDYSAGLIDLTIPDLLLCEVANALRFNRNFSQQEIEAVLSSLSQMGIEILPVGYEIVKSAVRLAYRNEITVYDAIYLALSCELFEYFITADKKLCKKLEDFPRVKLL